MQAVLCKAFSTSSRLPSRLLRLSPEVSHALSRRQPVVALESTIITHGMPYPSNLETAQGVEDVVRSQGCVPATIALLDGFVQVGLDDQQLERLALASSKGAMKASRRDMAYVLSQNKIGSTTVAGTMVAAHMAGIRVFVTGGIGGVHRGGESTMDVSADLLELGRTPVAVVCAGVKSILDIGRTLEVLETQGVPVITYGSDEFPAFYVGRSGFKASHRLDTPLECAKLMREEISKTSLDLGLNGMLFAVPIPKKDEVVDADTLNNVISVALKDASDRNIAGKDITPFLLERVKTLTDGGSLSSNIALIKNNALVGSLIAKEYASITPRTSVTFGPSSPLSHERPRPLIVGGTVLDITAKFTDPEMLPGTSQRGTVIAELGGVGRNVAEACFRTGGHPRFWSLVGNDVFGRIALDGMTDIGMVRRIYRSFLANARVLMMNGIKDTSEVRQAESGSTAVYNALLLSGGDLVSAVADMKIHHLISPPPLEGTEGIVVVDGNVAPSVIKSVAKHFRSPGAPGFCIFEPTSVPKATLFMEALGEVEGLEDGIHLTTPNEDEAVVMVEAAERFGNLKQHDAKLGNAAVKLGNLFKYNVIKIGRRGVIVTSRNSDGVSLTHLTPERVMENCVSVTGAGDTLVGALTSYLSTRGAAQPTLDDVVKGVQFGMSAALETLSSPRSVAETLSPALLDQDADFV
ncbi:hypothetical protein HDU96_004711 [Phlyctochytrium bullatum]|nr:hypothetical protein HDU96_004711 [Phlyctochytrium bullatum]